MPTKYCFLCASDEGVFLDVTTENKQTFYTQFKTCSLVKVPTSDQLPTKICYKCAYELNQCSTFLKNYKRATKPKTYNQRKCCNLCYEQRSREYTFDLSKENTLELKFINKIQQVLNDKVNTIQKNNIVVCLFCRYTVDVLFDLKNLSNGIASKLDNKLGENIDYSSLPKVKTTVISRKTTITESARATLKTKENTDNNSDGIIMRTRSKYNEKDIEAQSPAETKVCKIFLKDVLNQKAVKKAKQVNETEKDVANKGKQKATAKQLRLLNSDTERDTKKQPEKRPIKSANSNDSNNKDVPNKKAKRGQKETVKEREPSSPPSEPVSSRLTRNRKAAANERHVAEIITDSDATSSIDNAKEAKAPLTKLKKITGTSLSDADVEIKSNRKQLKSILAGVSLPKGSDTNDESLTDDGASKKKKLRFNSDAPIYIDLTTTSDEKERPRKYGTRRGTAKTKKIGRPPLAKKSPENSEVEVQTDSTIEEEEIKTYSCEECGVNYENRLAFLTHKLTHCKQPILELEKVAVESKPNAVLQDAGEAGDEQSEDQLEAIGITVDDDEEEVELESSNLDSSADTNLSSSHVKEDATSAEIPVSLNTSLLTQKDAVEPEVPSKELDSDQPTEKDDKDKKSLQGQRSRSVSLSTDKASAENVEDILLTNIEDNQEEEEEEEKEKEVGRESERNEKAEDGEAAVSEDATAAAVAEEKEAEKQDTEKQEETISIEQLGGDVDEDKLDSSEKIDADKTQGEAKSDSPDGSQEKNDTTLLEKPEEKESRDSSDVLEENLNKEKEKLEISDKSEANLVEENLDESPDKSEEVRLNEKDKTDFPRKSEERRVTRTKRSVTFAIFEEEGKQSSPENSREKSSSPDKSEGRKSPRRNRSSTIVKLEEDTRESSETAEETDKLGSPVRSEERRSTRMTRSSLLGKIEKDRQNSPEKSEEKDKSVSSGRSEERKSIKRRKVEKAEDNKESAEKSEEEESEETDKLGSPVRSEERLSIKKRKVAEDNKESAEKPEEEESEETDKLGSPVTSEERKSTRMTRSSLLGKIEKDGQNSPEKSEEKDKSVSSARSEERKSIKRRKVEKAEDNKESAEKSDEEESEENKATRNNKSNLIEKSEEKNKQDSAEKSKDELVSSEKLDEEESEEKKPDKDDAIIEINGDDSSDSVKEVFENECNNEIDIDDAEEVQVVESNDETTSDVEEICEKKEDDRNEDKEVQCAETNCSDKSSNKKSNDAHRDGEDIVEVDAASTQPMPTSDSTDAVSEILQLVLDLASTEIQKRQDSAEIVGEDDSDDAETLENISREVQSGGNTKP